MDTQPFIGVICDASFSALAGRIKTSGYRIARLSPAMLLPGSLPPVDAWVVDCNDDELVADALAWIETPVVALSNRPSPSDRVAFKAWADRIVKTLDKWTADARHGRSGAPSSVASAWADVEGVWVLAGAEGTDDAVEEFLASMPLAPPVAFVYAQHSEGSQSEAIQRFMQANDGVTCTYGLGRHWLNPRQLLVTPNTHRIQFTNQGEVFSLRDSWGGKDCPNIDHLILEMMGMQPGPSGVILFSGACGDGLQGAQALRTMGARVWSQSPDSANEPRLPQAVQKLGLASNTGTPAELAADLAGLYAPSRVHPPVAQVVETIHLDSFPVGATSHVLAAQHH
jgi:chemotaxis response regulator CheB